MGLCRDALAILSGEIRESGASSIEADAMCMRGHVLMLQRPPP